MTKYKQMAEEAQRELEERMRTIDVLKHQLEDFQNQFVMHAGENLDSEDAKEILRVFAPYAKDRSQLVLLVRALSKLPA